MYPRSLAALNALPGRADGVLVPGDPAVLQVHVPPITASPLLMHIGDTLSIEPEVTPDGEGVILSWRLSVAQVELVVGGDQVTPGTSARPYRVTAGSGDDLQVLLAGRLVIWDRWSSSPRPRA